MIVKKLIGCYIWTQMEKILFNILLLQQNPWYAYQKNRFFLFYKYVKKWTQQLPAFFAWSHQDVANLTLTRKVWKNEKLTELKIETKWYGKFMKMTWKIHEVDLPSNFTSINNYPTHNYENVAKIVSIVYLDAYICN